MDAQRFEELSRRVGAAGSRRAAVKAVAATLAAPVLLRLGQEEASAGLPIVHCKAPGYKCDKKVKCCSGRCKKQLCLCSKKGAPCWNPLEGALCCSQRCANGRCA